MGMVEKVSPHTINPSPPLGNSSYTPDYNSMQQVMEELQTVLIILYYD